MPGGIPFTPSASVTVQGADVQVEVAVPGRGHYMRFANNGPGSAWVLFFEVFELPPVVQVGTSMLLPAGAIEIFSVASDTTMVALLGDATGCQLNVSRGEGA